jgi:hypothetical protein
MKTLEVFWGCSFDNALELSKVDPTIAAVMLGCDFCAQAR